MPRVAPITGKSDVAPQHHAVVDEVLKVFGNVRGPFSMLLHSPKLAERLLAIGNFYRDEGIVAGKDRSLAILVGVRERQAVSWSLSSWTWPCGGNSCTNCATSAGSSIPVGSSEVVCALRGDPGVTSAAAAVGGAVAADDDDVGGRASQ